MLDAIVITSQDPAAATVLPALAPLGGLLRLFAVAVLVALPLDLARIALDGDDQLTAGTLVGHGIAATIAATIAIAGLSLVVGIIAFADGLFGI